MASDYVGRLLNDLIYDIYKEAKYSRNGKMITPEKLLWNKTIKTWQTVYAICTEKIYNYNKKIIGYILKDFNGNTLRVEPRDLKIAIALNKIDVVNLHLSIVDNELDRLTEVTMYDVESFNELNKVLKSITDYKTYVIGNPRIGYFSISGSTLLDYKGYCNEIVLPNLRNMDGYCLSFNDYVNIVHIPDTYEHIQFSLGYGSAALKEIYIEFSANKLIETCISNCYLSGGIYKRLRDRDDVIVHAANLNVTSREFFELLEKRNELTTQLKIKQSNINSNDSLQRFIIKQKMLGLDTFDIDFKNRRLTKVNMRGDIDTLKLPPVNKLSRAWYSTDYYIDTLYLPETLDDTELSTAYIPHYEERLVNRKTGERYYKDRKLVDVVVIPEGCKVKFIPDRTDTTDRLDIIFKTSNGTGKSSEIIVDVPNKGFKVYVVDRVDHPTITSKDGRISRGYTNVVIQDAAGNRKLVSEAYLISKVLDGDVQLVNADVLLNKTVRVRK